MTRKRNPTNLHTKKPRKKIPAASISPDCLSSLYLHLLLAGISPDTILADGSD